MNKPKDYQVIVVGAGHAGCEAALACARAGVPTLLLTISIDAVAAMPCNPSIGGQGKGQLVREIDALGGEMGVVADETSIQRRRLNTRKGIAVQANRFQSDKEAYSQRMLCSIMAQSNLCLLQGMAAEVLLRDNSVRGVKMVSGEIWEAPIVILTTGTFLRGLIHIGKRSFAAGRAGEPSAEELGKSLEDIGLPVLRFKTGTPPRLLADSINYDGLERQDEEEGTPPFSLRSKESAFPARPCFITRTNVDTHQIIRENFDKSALMAGLITGTGARYCPSIEDKLSKFPDKDTHKVFIEPEGADSHEVYLQGLSTSLPEEVQEKYVRTVKGLEEALITRPGYGIEYDIVDPQDLFPTLMSKSIKNLFLAGQINGTSGYEEAAAQGLLAGLNAIALVQGRVPLVLDANESYLGLMVQDITTLGISEPYRVFTSRSPFRLNLRMTNAEERLSHIANNYGLLSDADFSSCRQRLSGIQRLQDKLHDFEVYVAENNSVSCEKIAGGRGQKSSIARILARPDARLQDFVQLIPEIGELDMLASIELEARIKYAGYFSQQQKEFELRDSMKSIALDDTFFDALPAAISKEARMKILAVRPENIGRLSLIPGVRASDLALVLMTVKKRRANHE